MARITVGRVGDGYYPGEWLTNAATTATGAAMRQASANMYGDVYGQGLLGSLTSQADIWKKPENTKTKTFREELQQETDNWLK